MGYTIDSKLGKTSILSTFNVNLRKFFFLFCREISEKIRIRKAVDNWIKTISAEIQVGIGKKQN